MSLNKRTRCGFLFSAMIFCGSRAALAANVAVIGTGTPSDDAQWCQLLQDHGHQCTIFPNSGATASELAPFQVIIDLSYVWSDPDGVLADAMRARKGVILWAGVPEVLGIDSNVTVQDWIGASAAIQGMGQIRTTAHDPILGSRPPGTGIGNCIEPCHGLSGTGVHDGARALALISNNSNLVAILRNTWEGGQSIYMSDFAPWDTGGIGPDLALNSVEVLSHPIPTTSPTAIANLSILLVVGGLAVLYRRRRQICVVTVPIALLAFTASNSLGQLQSSTLSITSTNDGTTMQLGTGDPFHITNNAVTNARTISVPNSPILLILWSQSNGSTVETNWYAVALDGANVDTVRKTTYMLKLRYAEFDPTGAQPIVPDTLSSRTDTSLWIVQFVTQPLDEFRGAALRPRHNPIPSCLSRRSHANSRIA